MQLYSYLKRIFYVHQKRISLYRSFTCGILGLIAFTVLMHVGYFAESPIVMAPFGASCILVFSRPRFDSSQPINVIGGYLIASTVGVSFMHIFPHEIWLASLMLVTTTTLMAFFRVTHPPAGAVPLVVFFYEQYANIEFIIYTAFVGSTLLVLLAIILHNLPPKQIYPRHLPNKKNYK